MGELTGMHNDDDLRVTPQERKDLAKLDKKIASLANHMAPGAKPKPKVKKRRAKVIPLQELIDELKRLFGHEGIEGVYGYVVNVRTAKSRLQLKWGDIRSPLRSKG